MIFEIREVGFVNKGAELMLYTILDKISELFPGARFTMAPQKNKGYEDFIKRAQLGILQKVAIYNENTPKNKLAHLIPRKIRESYGLVLNSEVDVVLDAAGFAYSDQWGLKKAIQLEKYSKALKRNEKKLILLPQAFGPFSSKDIIKTMNSIADNSSLIFAREEESYKHLINAVGERSNIKVAPDFTNCISGILPDYYDPKNMEFCIIPNYRMIDKTDSVSSKAYLPFITNSIQYLLEKNIKPFFLIHEGNKDLILAEKVQENLSQKITTVTETHPLKIKGILGACQGSLGSRFHGLVSALSQGTPSLGTGWSHKYQMLFNDYGFNEGLIDVRGDRKVIRDKIDLITDEASKLKIKNTLTDKSNKLKTKTADMWQEIETMIKK